MTSAEIATPAGRHSYNVSPHRSDSKHSASLALLLLAILGPYFSAASPAFSTLPIESQTFQEPRLAVQVWQAGGASASSTRSPKGRTLTSLRFRFAFETEPDETYLLTRTFTVLTNGVMQSTLAVPELIQGQGTIQRKTNTLVPTIQRQCLTFMLDSTPLLREVDENTSVRIAAVTLEPYGSGCPSCSRGEPPAPGRPGPLLAGAHLQQQAIGPIPGGLLLRFSLGQSATGQALGELFVSAALPTSRLCQPEALRLLALPGGVTEVREPRSGCLRQVRSSQCLADIVRLNDFSCQIAFYAGNDLSARISHASPKTLVSPNGLSPLVTWILENPDAASACNRLRVIEGTGGKWITNSYAWYADNQKWEFVAGNGLRKQTLIRAWDETHTVRTETAQTIEPLNDRLVQQNVAILRQFPWGEGVVEEVAGTGSSAQTNRYSYNHNPASPAYGWLQQWIRHDGSWERSEYDDRGRLKTRFLPFENTAPADFAHGRVFTCDYSPWSQFGDVGLAASLRPRTITETVQGVVVKKTYFIAAGRKTIEVRCNAPSRVPFDGAALSTTNWFSWTLNARRLQRIDHPDGTIDLFRYAAGPGCRTNLIFAGQPNADRSDVINGTKTIVVAGSLGQMLLKEVYDRAPGRDEILIAREARVYTDDLQRSHTTAYLDGTSNLVQYACCGLESIVDPDGVLTAYNYDDLKRVKSESRLVDGLRPITTEFTYDAADHLLSTVRVGTDGTRHRRGGSSYDTAARLRFQTNALGGVTTLTYGRDGSGRFVISNTYPNRGTRIESYNADGSLYELTGTAEHGLRYEYQVAGGGLLLRKETRLDEAGEPTAESVTEFTDLLGRAFKTQYPDGASEETYYNAKGQLTSRRDPDGVTTLHGYNSRGEHVTTAVRTDSTNLSDVIDFSGRDRITQTLRDVIFDRALGVPVQRRRVFLWDAFGKNHSNLVATFETSTDGLKSWRTEWNSTGTSFTEVSYEPNGHRILREVAPDLSLTVSKYHFGRLESVQNFSASNSVLAETLYEYDDHNRLATATGSHTGRTAYGYNEADQVVTLTSGASEPGRPAQTTTTFYDLMLQPTNVTFPDQTSLFTEYHPTGDLSKSYGSRQYPVEYTCDYAGRIKSVRTCKDMADSASAAVTTWNYDPQRGWLINKRYANGQGPDYEHMPSGKLHKRIWARETAPGSGRRLETVYGYNPAGDLETVTYNDAVTPALAYTWNRRGRPVAVVQGSTTTTLAYNTADQVVNEVCEGGLLDGMALTNSFDRLLRRDSVTLNSSCATIRVCYAYDLASRLQVVSNNEWRVNYSYADSSAVPRLLAFNEGDHTRLLVTNAFDPLNRLVSISTVPENGAAVRYDYNYNEANQPSRVTCDNASYWSYTYDSLGQVSTAGQFQQDGTPLASHQFDYRFDACGNRVVTRNGTDQPGPIPPSTFYAANNLNQYTNRLAPGSSTPESFTFDDDGNLASNARWVLSWDAENRLVRLVTRPGTEPPQRIEFTYDWRSRRVGKKVWDNPTGTGNPVADLRFAYDGWNLLAILNSKTSILRSFTWGSDLSGTPGGAGGTGGLLMIQEHASVAPDNAQGCQLHAFFPACDGNGNVMALIDGADGTIAARYQYGPFGETLDQVEAKSVENPFLFATRYQDKETGFFYYGYRYYDPSTGRWLSRDPRNELAFGQIALRGPGALEVDVEPTVFEPSEYVYARNMPSGTVDILGLASCDRQIRNALQSRWNRRLLQSIFLAGGQPPRIIGADQEGYCRMPGFLGDYQCDTRQGKICCLNVASGTGVERTMHHELIHALDCCQHSVTTCEDHICSEIVAYYNSDCEWFANRLDCALQQMRKSIQDPKCAPQVAAANWETARTCLKAWRNRQRD